MTLYALKPGFQALLRPIVATLAASGVSANQVTIAALAGSVLLGAGLVFSDDVRWFWLLAPWLLLRMALNAIDGMLAREHDQRTPLGSYLNELADVLSDAALLAPFALVAPFNPAWVGAVILFAVVSEFAGVLGPNVGASRRYDGPMGKSDRALIIGVLGLWLGLGGSYPDWLAWLMPLMVLLLLITCVRRVKAGLREIGA
jgi:CDP-diacylglycerol--glycerol-3-phosphate 3-phosphatidyltransferase